MRADTHLRRPLPARFFAITLVVAGIGCRQIFGLEEPQESSGVGGGSSSSSATDTSSSSTGDASSSSGGDPCLASSKEQVVLGSVDPPGITLGCDKDYLLNTDVTVLGGATLTIAPGTTIRAKADVRLIVERGAKLMAEGSVDRPIVFTKGESVPWGGIELRGRAPGFGFVCENDLFAFDSPGAPTDSSGVLKYVRLDHAGSQQTECTGALMLLGVGSGTVLEHLDVASSGSDGVSIAGGNPQLSHVVITDSVDDGFDIENDANTKLQFVVYRGIADPGTCTDGSRCPDGIDADDPDTNVEVRNATFCGHQVNLALHQGVLVGTGASVTLRRSIVVDHEAALDVEEMATAAVLETSVFSNEFDIGLPTETSPGDDADFDEEQFSGASYKNTLLANPPIQCFGTVNLVPGIPVGDPGPMLPADGFFVDAPHAGALVTGDDWMSAWIVVP